MPNKRGTPIGNRNAAGSHPGLGRYFSHNDKVLIGASMAGGALSVALGGPGSLGLLGGLAAGRLYGGVRNEIIKNELTRRAKYAK